ncbi:Membrane protease YdiL, CAAX protease family [Nakamurella panacisegetis]|uniref:Membrane protease YdiL, CAAX protease family n=1 Tax=Nakamurella panacisegetis TaxID=1090615 RepID=A0A1H0K8Z3_9ACTN|nr:CPBP family intramembrane glutamic endopeptidase [Nakamurella panacisegetis]SDO52273.1 Membrane protease YdiL, CAAX protease family [Nakamurella panacisegetis]
MTTSPSASPSRRNWYSVDPVDDFQLTDRQDTRRSIGTELSIVFLITLGMSGLTSLVQLIETQIKANQAKTVISHYVVAVAAPKSTVGYIDLVYQLLSITRGFAEGALGLYLLWRAGFSLSRRLGLNLRRPGWDIGLGFGLAAVIGIPGLGLYLLSQHFGYSLTVQASTMTDVWWRVPVTVLIALENGFLEEVLVVGYLTTRLRQLRWSTAAVIAGSAFLRGTYHLYQGYGAFVGNAIMGIVFSWFYLRFRRLWPLVIAHSLIDTVTLVAYPLLKGHVSWLP